MITQIFNTLNRVDAKKKQGTVLLDKDISVTVLIDINNTQTKWTDNEKGYIVDEIYKRHFNGTLKDCLVYLESFCMDFRGCDLNEIKYMMENA